MSKATCRQVADCVCLMSLNKFEAVPVDTHIWQVAMRDYKPQLASGKSLTNVVYQEIGNLYKFLNAYRYDIMHACTHISYVLSIVKNPKVNTLDADLNFAKFL